MVSPLRIVPDAWEHKVDHFGVSYAPIRTHEHPISEHCPGETPDDADLERLQRSLEWLKRERMIAALEAGTRAQNHRRRLPLARGLDPVSGIPHMSADPSGQKRDPLKFQLAAPLASERIQSPMARRRHAYSDRGALCILIASVLAGSILYYISVGKFSTSQPAQAASFQAAGSSDGLLER